MTIQYFKLSEFDGKTATGERIPGTGGNMRASTLIKCDELRVRFGKPLIVASGYRTPERNAQVGGVKNSSHLLGYAVDWKDITDAEMIAFLDAAWAAGWAAVWYYGNVNPHRRRPNQDKPSNLGLQ